MRDLPTINITTPFPCCKHLKFGVQDKDRGNVETLEELREDDMIAAFELFRDEIFVWANCGKIGDSCYILGMGGGGMLMAEARPSYPYLPLNYLASFYPSLLSCDIREIPLDNQIDGRESAVRLIQRIDLSIPEEETRISLMKKNFGIGPK
jgi:hypothetical protein